MPTLEQEWGKPSLLPFFLILFPVVLPRTSESFWTETRKRYYSLLFSSHLFPKEIWWGEVNIPQPPETYRLLEDIAINYLNTRPKVPLIFFFLLSPFLALRDRWLCRLGPQIQNKVQSPYQQSLSCPVHAQHDDCAH